jgi:SET domain-containing protein
MLLVKTCLAPSRIHGIGLFASEPIPRGTVVWRRNPAVDVALSDGDLARLAEPCRAQVLRYAYLDPTIRRWILCGDDARFFNHADRPNCRDTREVDGETVAARDIEAGEELTADYTTFDAAHLDPLLRDDA